RASQLPISQARGYSDGGSEVSGEMGIGAVGRSVVEQAAEHQDGEGEGADAHQDDEGDEEQRQGGHAPSLSSPPAPQERCGALRGAAAPPDARPRRRSPPARRPRRGRGPAPGRPARSPSAGARSPPRSRGPDRSPPRAAAAPRPARPPAAGQIGSA